MYSFGIYDSGIGGLTTLFPLKKHFPYCDFFFLADTKSNPLGTKSALEIEKTVNDGLKFLREQSHIQVIACNTASTVVKPQNAYLLQPTLANLSPKVTLVLSTPATTKALKLDELGYATADTENLASTIEALANMAFEQKDISAFYSIENLICSIVEQAISAKNINTIYLGCSHYLYFKALLKMRYPTMKILDGNHSLISRLSSENLTRGNKKTMFNFTLGDQQEKYQWLLDQFEENPRFLDI